MAESLKARVDEAERLRRRLAMAQRALDAERKRRQQALEVAARVHRSLLPQPVRHRRIQIDVRYIPIEGVGGDYCQVRLPDPDVCYITMCDVTGHGIGAALLATRASSEVRRSILDRRSPGDIVQSLNTFICDFFAETNLYLTFTAARIDLRQRRITFSGAGHPAPLLIRQGGGDVRLLESRSPLVGVSPDFFGDVSEQAATLQPGDRLLFYTDGLTESADARGRQLGTVGLSRIAVAAMSVDLFEMADQILNEIASREHGPPTDDKTLIVAKVT